MTEELITKETLYLIKQLKSDINRIQKSKGAPVSEYKRLVIAHALIFVKKVRVI